MHVELLRNSIMQVDLENILVPTTKSTMKKFSSFHYKIPVYTLKMHALTAYIDG